MTISKEALAALERLKREQETLTLSLAKAKP